MGPGGILFAGFLYTYSFTGSIGATAFLVLAKSYPPLVLALFGAIGSTLADLSILRLFERYGFAKELNSLAKEKKVKSFFKCAPFLTSKVVLSILGILTIASPLPDELGIVLIERGKLFFGKYFLVLDFTANTIGILALTALR
jgi:hypothetical protein